MFVSMQPDIVGLVLINPCLLSAVANPTLYHVHVQSEKGHESLPRYRGQYGGTNFYELTKRTLS
jgi:hypothetical protein